MGGIWASTKIKFSFFPNEDFYFIKNPYKLLTPPIVLNRGLNLIKLHSGRK